jgi:hypothetical protein
MKIGWRENKYIHGWQNGRINCWMDLWPNEQTKINLHKHFMSLKPLVLTTLPATSMNFIHNVYVIRYE